MPAQGHMHAKILSATDTLGTHNKPRSQISDEVDRPPMLRQCPNATFWQYFEIYVIDKHPAKPWQHVC